MLARPIRFTSDIPAFRSLLTALGGSIVVEEDGGVVIALDSGRLALRAASNEKPSGTTALGFEVVDLDAVVTAAAAGGVDVSLQQQGPDRFAVVRADDGLEFTIEDGSGDAAGVAAGVATGGLTIMPLWYSTDAGAARTVIGSIGGQPRMSSNSGVWSDFVCDAGGLVAVHVDTVTSASLSFEYDGDLDAFAEHLRGHDVDARIIDENYSRVLLVPDPDGGSDLWINHRQQDLYGYTATPRSAPSSSSAPFPSSVPWPPTR